MILSNHSFYYCENLTNIYATLGPLGDESLANCKNLQKIYLEEGKSIFLAAVNDTPNLKIYTKDKSKVGYIMADSKALYEEAVAKVVEDKTAPKVSVSYSKKDITNKSVTVTIKSTDGKLLKPIEGWKSSSGYKTLTKKYTSNVNEEVNVSDFVGNNTKTNIKIANIDKTAPKIEISGTTGRKWKNTSANVKVKAKDKNGIKSLEIQKVGSSKKYKIKGSQGTVKLNKYGQYKVVAIDKAGNKKTSATFWNYVDTEKPEIESATSNDNGKVTAKVKDTTSGISSVKLIGDGKTYTAKTIAKDGTVLFNVKTTGTYTLKVSDNAGNIKTQKIKVTIKETEPVEDDPHEEGEDKSEETPTTPEEEDDVTVDEDSVEDGNEDDVGKDEITGTDDSSEEEVEIETDTKCSIEFDETNKTATIIKYLGTEDILELPTEIEKGEIKYTITKIEKEAFKDTGIRRIKIPETVKEIGDNAFDNCSYLEEVIIQNDNILIGNNAFTSNDGKVRIYSRQGSTAETFAKSNNIGFGIYIKEGDFEYIVKEKVFEEYETTEDGEEGTEERKNCRKNRNNSRSNSV